IDGGIKRGWTKPAEQRVSYGYGDCKAAEWRRRALHSLYRRCGFGPSPSFDCTIFAVLSAKWPSRLWTVSPSAGRWLPDDDKAHDESRLRLLFGLRIKSFSLR